MARRVVWSVSAREELRAARDWIAGDSPSRASEFVRRVLAAAGSLGDFSERGRPVAGHEMPGLREIRVQSYRLIYRVEPETIGILALIHVARDEPRAWAERPREG